MASIQQAQRRLTGRSSNPHRVTALALALGSAALLSACFGGGGDDGPAATEAAAAAVLQVVKVVDGPIKGALVCLDKNENGSCDADEVQGTTAEDGTVTLSVPAADSLRYPVLALVGVGAVDADNGPVATAYVMRTAPDMPGLVTPLTTLVALQAAAAGVSTAEAERIVQDKLGTSAPLLVDYSGKRDPDSAYIAAVARLVVVTSQQQALATAGAKDGSGNAVPQVDMERAIHDSLLIQLPALAAAAIDPTVAGAGNATEREAAIQTAAASAATAAGLTRTNLASVLAVAKLPAAGDASGAPVAGATLRWFSFTDAQNYSFRLFKATAEQNVVVDGVRKFTEYREQSAGSKAAVTFYQQWGEGLNNWARNQVVWTGSEWFACPTDFVSTATPWSAKGESTSLYCKGFKSSNKRVGRDISGLRMADVVAEIRTYPGQDTAGKFSAWGPDPVVHASALGGAFPAGSVLHYYTGSDVVNPDAYNTTPGDTVAVYGTAVANGSKAECDQVTGSNFERFRIRPATLEQMASGAPGVPCTFGLPTNGGESVNEWWSNSTLSIGNVPDAYLSSTGYYKSGTKSLRVSFAAGGVARYWLCLLRASDNSVRNCASAGAGSYSVEPLGGARVMRLAGQPAAASLLGYTRNFVERGGRVFYGYRSKLTTTQQVRPNLEASAALMAALGMPAPRAALSALTADDWQTHYTNKAGTGTFNRIGLKTMPNDPAGIVGAWALDSATDERAIVIFFFPDGQYALADPTGDVQCGSAGLERGTYSWDSSTGRLNGLISTLDTNGCGGLHDTTHLAQPFGPGITFKPVGDGKSVTVNFADGSGIGTFYRLSP